MKHESRKTGTSGVRALLRRLSHPVNAVATIGIAGSLAVTPLLAGGAAQLSAGLAAMPIHVQASVSGSDVSRRFEPRADYKVPAPTEIVRSELRGRVFQASLQEDGIVAGPAVPQFADFDPQRFSTRRAAEEPSPAGASHAPVSADAAPVVLASLDQRFAAAVPSVRPDPVLPEIANAEAGEDDPMSVPLPVQRPRIASVPEPDNASRAPAATASAPERQRAESAGARKGDAPKALAYANPDVSVEEDNSRGIFGRLFGRRNESLLPGRGSKVAVYDIGAAIVYMPNGEKLEAHSGLAHMKDNPRYVAEKNKGPTPPNLYKLRMRESRFHGVEAIRLLPADGKKKYNRDGLLAHTYMYVRNGGKDKSQSNGCVVFADYDRFLKAFKRGDIKHLIVVPHLKEVPTYMAAL